MNLEEITQAIQYLALLHEVQSSEHGSSEMSRDETGIRWRCRYCHGAHSGIIREHKEDCVYQRAAAWRTAIAQGM